MSDVFLSHAGRDKPIVEAIGERLRAKGPTGMAGQVGAATGVSVVGRAGSGGAGFAVGGGVPGAEGLGSWEEPEMWAFLARSLREKLPVIPVLLPGCAKSPRQTLVLEGLTWVDLRGGLSDEGLARPIWGITGENDGEEATLDGAQSGRPTTERVASGTKKRRVHWHLLLWASLVGAILTVGACSGAVPTTSPVLVPASRQAFSPATASNVTPVKVISLTLGKSIGTDKKVIKDTDTFSPNDTLYAVVETEGSASYARLSAHWFFAGPTRELSVKEDDLTIAPSGKATSEFHVWKPDGWPVGNNRVEIFLDSRSVAVKAFRVTR